MSGDVRLEQLVAEAPINANAATPDFGGIYEALGIAGIEPGDIVAVSRCHFGKANIEALVDDDTIAFVRPGGVVCTKGSRKMLGKAVKYSEVKFSQCRGLRHASTPMTVGLASSESSSVVRATFCLGVSTGVGRPSGFAIRPRRSWQWRKSATACWES